MMEKRELLYKVGDMVRITNPDKDYEAKRYPLGTLGQVTEVETYPDGECCIEVTKSGDEVGYFYHPNEISPWTNGDKLRSTIPHMTDEELAKFLSEFRPCVACELYDTRTKTCSSANKFLCANELATFVTELYLQRSAEQ